MSIDRVRVLDAGCLPCMTSRQRIWMADQARFLVGYECMLAQGLHYGPDLDPRLRGCSNILLQDLAANAFHVGSIAAVVVSVFSALAVSAVCGAEREQDAETEDGKNDKDKCIDLFDLWMK